MLERYPDTAKISWNRYPDTVTEIPSNKNRYPAEIPREIQPDTAEIPQIQNILKCRAREKQISDSKVKCHSESALD
jgi:hypothetical protein